MKTAAWDPGFVERSAAFEPLRAAAGAIAGGDWPAPGALQRALESRAGVVASGGGAPVTFVRQSPRGAAFEDRYEPRIFLRGEVQVRGENWHDLFNALVWITFPRAKAALNARHFRALEAQRAARQPNRGPVQDALTLLDESGLVVAAADRELLALIDRFAWRELFWANRARVAAGLRFYAFGHALCEKLLAPYPGITAHAVRFGVDEGFLAAPLPDQLESVDAMLARRLADAGAFASTRELAPVPVLGIPGWHPGNREESFYADARQFRGGRGRA